MKELIDFLRWQISKRNFWLVIPTVFLILVSVLLIVGCKPIDKLMPMTAMTQQTLDYANIFIPCNQAEPVNVTLTSPEMLNNISIQFLVYDDKSHTINYTISVQEQLWFAEVVANNTAVDKQVNAPLDDIVYFMVTATDRTGNKYICNTPIRFLYDFNAPEIQGIGIIFNN